MFSYFKKLFGSSQKHTELEGLAFVDQNFKNLVGNKQVPGLAAAIWHDGSKILEKGYGYANLETSFRVNPKTTLFRIASISKCITGLVFGKMVEEGLLDWEDSIYQYVPEYPNKKHDFNLLQLASHTAGIRAYRGKEYALNKPYSIQDSIEFFKEDPLLYTPGEGYLYSSLDFVLLSLAMERASGISFWEYARDKVLLPLGMTNTVPPLEKVLETRSNLNLASFYTPTKKGFKLATTVDNNYKLAGGGYLSTVEDIAKLGFEILEQRLLKKTTYQMLLQSRVVKGKPSYYGVGFQVSQDNQGYSFVGHVGNSVGAYTNFFVYPSKRLVFSMVTNCNNSNIQEELDASIAALLRKF